jgi:hypothetical protein
MSERHRDCIRSRRTRWRTYYEGENVVFQTPGEPETVLKSSRSVHVEDWR